MLRGVARCSEADEPRTGLQNGFAEPQRDLWNFKRMPKEAVDKIWGDGIKLLEFSMVCSRIQHEAGRYFVHGHPNSASSWP